MIEDVAAKIECELVLAVESELSASDKAHNAA